MPTPVLRPEAANISLHDLSSREWRKRLAGYAKPNTLRASFQLDCSSFSMIVDMSRS